MLYTGMWQRFSNTATRVIFFAQEEAKQLRTNVVGTEHLLLGLLREGEGVAARVLKQLGIDLERMRAEVEQQVSTPEDDTVESGRLTLSLTAKKALKYALQEAQEWNRKFGMPNVVNTEHILLGVLRTTGSKAHGILKVFQIDSAQVRQTLLTIMETVENSGEDGSR